MCFQLSNFVRYNVLKKHTDVSNRSIGMILPYGLGDTYLVCSLLPAFLKKYDLKEVKLIVKPGHEYICKIFGFEENVFSYKDINKYLSAVLCFGSKTPGQIFAAHPNYVYGGIFLPLIGYKNINLLDVYKLSLGLPPTASVVWPKDFSKIKNIVSAKLHRFGMSMSKSMIIFPEANSVGMLSTSIWKSVINTCKQKSIKVYCSTQNPHNLIPDTIPISIPLDEVVDTVEYAGNTIALRSGICEVFSRAKANKIVLYPIKKWYSGNLIVGCSLVNMGLNNDIIEVEVGRSNVCQITAALEKVLSS